MLILSFNHKKTPISPVTKPFLQGSALTFLFGLPSLLLLHVQFAEQPALLLQDLVIDQHAGGCLMFPQR